MVDGSGSASSDVNGHPGRSGIRRDAVVLIAIMTVAVMIALGSWTSVVTPVPGWLLSLASVVALALIMLTGVVHAASLIERMSCSILHYKWMSNFGKGPSIAIALIAWCVPFWVYVAHVHPSEPMFGNEDQGIYAICGAHLARTGAYHADHPIVADPDASPLVVQSTRTEGIRDSRGAPRRDGVFIGFYRDTKDPSLIGPAFPPAYPFLLAGAQRIAEWKGSGFVNPVLCAAASITLGVIVASWFGALAGFLAYAVMLLNPLQIWSANNGYAEPLAQWIWIAAIAAFVTNYKSRTYPILVFASLCAVAILVKIDALPLTLLVVPVIAVLAADRKMGKAIASGVLVVLLAFVIWTLWRNNPDYLVGTIRGVMDGLGHAQVVITGLVALGIGVTVFAFFERRIMGSPLALASGSVAVRWVIPLSVIALFIYAYAIRPRTGEPDHFFYWPMNQEILSLREQTLVRFGWYTTQGGLIAALVGVVWALRGAKSLPLWLFLGIGVLTTVVICRDLYNYPSQPYGMRRLVCFGIPLFAVSLGVLSQITPRWPRTLSAVLGSVLVLAVLIGQSAVRDRINPVANFKGVAEALTKVAASIPDNSIVVIGRNDPWSIAASTLHVGFGKTVVMHGYPLGQPQLEHWRGLAAKWAGDGRPLYQLGIRSSAPILPNAKLSPVLDGQIEYWYYVSDTEGLRPDPVGFLKRYRVGRIEFP